MSIQQNFPGLSPSLSLNFARSKQLDSRVSFTRSSSATYMDAEGIIRIAPADSPRFDHAYDTSTGSFKSLGLLIEESRTNLLTYSEQIDDTSWTKSLSSVTANVGIAPNGTFSADLWTEDTTANDSHWVRKTVGLTSNVTYTFSTFIKRNGRDVTLQINNPSAAQSVVLFTWNLSNGTYTGVGTPAAYPGITGTAGSITSYPNNWYRISATFTAAVSGNSYFYIEGDANPTGIKTSTPKNTGDGTSGFYLWGAQVEQGSFPTSYIPTTAATVTRSADTAFITGTNFSSWFNQSEGTVFCSFKNNTIDFVTRRNVYSIVGSAGLGGIEIRSPNIGVNRLRFVYNENFNAIPNEFSASLSLRKTAFAYNQSVSVAYIDNQPVTPATTHTNDTSKDNLIFGNRADMAIDYLNGTISQLTYYPKRLTNDQLQNLTK